MSKGWHNEYERHALAGMGVKTGNKKKDYTYYYANKKGIGTTGEKHFTVIKVPESQKDSQLQAKTIAKKHKMKLVGGCFTEQAKPYDLNKYRVLKATEKTPEVKEKKSFNVWDLEDPDGAGMTKEDQRKMWQHLVDTGQAWSLQGWYGRTAQALLDAGEIKYPKNKTHDFYGNPIPTRKKEKDNRTYMEEDLPDDTEQ